jgi:hypothetical protein
VLEVSREAATAPVADLIQYRTIAAASDSTTTLEMKQAGTKLRVETKQQLLALNSHAKRDSRMHHSLSATNQPVCLEAIPTCF